MCAFEKSKSSRLKPNRMSFCADISPVDVLSEVLRMYATHNLLVSEHCVRRTSFTGPGI